MRNVRFFIPMAASLKDKRSVLKRMIDRTKNSYNVSIAEIDHQDLWQRTTIALVATASSKDAAEREVRRAIRFGIKSRMGNVRVHG